MAGVVFKIFVDLNPVTMQIKWFSNSFFEQGYQYTVFAISSQLSLFTNFSVFM